MKDFTEPALRDVLNNACKQRGLRSGGARLLHHYSNAVFMLPDSQAVARITTNARTAETIETSQSVTGWLVESQAYPATAPLDSAAPVLFESGQAVSFWCYYPQPTVPGPFTAEHLPKLIRQLHDVPPVPMKLPEWTPLASLRDALAAERQCHGLGKQERAWLLEEIDRTGEQVMGTDWPLGAGLIHGDAWAGNLLWGLDTTTPILGDWDGVSIGPREVDLIPTWHAAARYGRTQEWVDTFAEVYGHDVSKTTGFPLLLRMRDLVQLSGPLRRAGDSPQHLAALRQRFEDIRDDDRSSTWVGL